MGFIDTMRSQDHAVESVCRVAREQGCQIAARTYRAWRTRRPATRTVRDAQLIDAIKDTCWRRDEAGTLRLTPATGHPCQNVAPDLLVSDHEGPDG